MSIQRYDLWSSGFVPANGEMIQADSGEYVLFDDHKATIATLTAENERLKHEAERRGGQLQLLINECKKTEAERDQARAAILAFGGGNDFDWNVLEEINQLRDEVEKLSSPTMWWEDGDPEMNCSSADEWLDNGYGEHLNHGNVVSFMTARGLPNRYYKIANVSDDVKLVEITKEEYDAAIAAKGATQ